MRHAKSSWDDPALGDHSRPLNARGLRDGPRVARALEARGWSPGRIVASDAVRARSTADKVAHALHDAPKVELDPGLYHASASYILNLARRRVGDAPLLLVGHNPGMADAVSRLAETNLDMPTASVALFQNRGGGWRLVEQIRPRDLAA